MNEENMMNEKKLSRREFVGKSVAAGMATAVLTKNAFAKEKKMNKKVLFVWGGWKGHEPGKCRDLYVPWLKQQGCDVTVSNTLDSYTDQDLMNSVDLIVQVWTMGKITGEQSKGLVAAVKNGAGLAGWHGGLCDSFRENTEYQFMTGGQWVAHPGGIVDYEVHIVDHKDPVTAGIKNFKLHSEQYYLHVDPANKVLATSTFNGEHDFWVKGTVMPVVWKKVFGKGHVFYASFGHHASDFDVSEALEIVHRGMRWASESKYEKTENLITPVYLAK